MDEIRLPRGPIAIEPCANGLDITVPPARHWLVVLFITGWLSGIAYLGLTWWPRIIGAIITGEAGGGDYFIAFVMSALTLGWFHWAKIVFQMVFGVQRVKLRPGEVRLSRGPARPNFERSFRIRDMIEWHAPKSGGLAFTYHGRLVQIAPDLGSEESARLLKRVLEALPAFRE